MLTRHSTKPLAAAAATLLAAAMLTASCGDIDDLYSDEPCYFVFDNSSHNDGTLATAMNPMAPGTYCLITESRQSGAIRFNFANNHGLTSYALANAIDQQRTRRLGRLNGIIVGYSTIDITNPPFVAYDAQCPACYTGTGLVSHQLTITSNGRASCSTCGRSYDMNNGGVLASGEPDGANNRLVQYYATTTGATGVLQVGNRP